MSTGAVIQLTAYGTQDLYLTGNPQITHFKSVIRRHTNFSIETVENHFHGKVSHGQKLSCKIHRTGDLIHQIYIKIDLPKLQNTQGKNNIYTSWTNAVGYAMIDYVEIQIGKRVIDKQYGQWMNIWAELTSNESKRDALNKMVGRHDFFTQSSQNGPLTLYVPLQFWFCNNIGSSLPLVAIQHQDIHINLQLKELASLWVSNDTKEAECLVKNTDIDHVSLYIDYIFLDVDERKYFAKNKHYYLIEQIQQHNHSIDISRTENIIELPFNHPVKELIWVIQGEEVKINNQWTNYSDDVINLLGDLPKSPMAEALIRFNGTDRIELRTEEYFRLILPWKYHTNIPNNYIYTYSFALEPEKLQPTGTANFSRLDRATLHITTTPDLKKSEISVYAINYNILRIISGIAGILFAN